MSFIDSLRFLHGLPIEVQLVFTLNVLIWSIIGLEIIWWRREAT